MQRDVENDIRYLVRRIRLANCEIIFVLTVLVCC